MMKFHDLLLKSCAETNLFANRSCKRDYVDEDNGCDWYHSAWQYLRVLDCVSAPQWHENFYLNAFDKIFADKKTIRILISGTADYSLLHLMLCALSKTEACAQIDVLDMCPTPLFSCEWYLNNYGAVFGEKKSKSLNKRVTVKMINKDLLYHNPADEQKYDLICTDAFLTRFKKQDAIEVVAKWRRLMSDIGTLVTTVRIHDKAEPRSLLKQTRDTDSFVQKVKNSYRHLIKDSKLFIMHDDDIVEELSEDELLFLARRYIIKMESNNLGGLNEIQKLIRDGGLEINDKLSQIEKVKGEITGSDYYRIVAAVK